MASYPPHPCLLPGCEAVTTNKECCCLEHGLELKAARRQAALAKRTRLCSACGKDKPLAEYKHRDQHGKTYTVRRCLECEAAGRFGPKKHAALVKARNKEREAAPEAGVLSGYLDAPFTGALALVDPWGMPSQPPGRIA